MLPPWQLSIGSLPSLAALHWRPQTQPLLLPLFPLLLHRHLQALPLPLRCPPRLILLTALRPLGCLILALVPSPLQLCCCCRPCRSSRQGGRAGGAPHARRRVELGGAAAGTCPTG